jgi:hypothetical protein
MRNGVANSKKNRPHIAIDDALEFIGLRIEHGCSAARPRTDHDRIKTA